MASSIKLFQFVQQCHQIIGVFPSQSNQNQRLIKSTKTKFLIFSAQLMVSTAGFLVFEAKSMFEYGFTFFILISIINSIVVYLIFIWQSKNTSKFVENCEGFIEKRVQSTDAYKELIGKIELFNKIFCFATCISDALLFFMVLPYTFARYFIFHRGDDSFYLFFPSWFPFDWKTPFGYLVAWMAQVAGATPMMSIYSHFPNFVFGIGWLFIFIAEDITQNVTAFNISAKSPSGRNRVKLTKCFCDMVQIYSDAKQCINEFNYIHEYSLFAFFAWTMLGASSILVTLQFQLWADHSNSFETISLIVVLIWTIIFISLFCEPGTRMTNQFVALNDELSQCDWYVLSIKMQRLYMIFISDTQKPMKMLSYANITCERETSQKIINKAFSYFMTFRKFRT